MLGAHILQHTDCYKASALGAELSHQLGTREPGQPHHSKISSKNPLSTFFSLSLKQSQVSSGHEENLTLIRVIAGKGEKGKVELELSEIKRICKNKCFEYKQQTHSIMIILASPLTTPNHFMREKKPIKQISFHFRDSKASPQRIVSINHDKFTKQE